MQNSVFNNTAEEGDSPSTDEREFVGDLRDILLQTGITIQEECSSPGTSSAAVLQSPPFNSNAVANRQKKNNRKRAVDDENVAKQVLGQMQQITSLVQSGQNTSVDVDDQFGKMVAAELRGMSPRKKKEAKRAVMEALFP